MTTADLTIPRGAHPLERLEEDTLWPQDQSWSPEVYRRVGQALFEQAHLDAAVVAWRLRLGAYPPDCETPSVYRALARAHRQLGDDDGLLRSISELAALIERGGEWVTRVCPGSARRAANAPPSAARTQQILRICAELAALAIRLAANPQAPAALLLAARLYRGAGHLDDAVELLQRIVDRYPGTLRGPIARADDAVIQVLGEAHFQLALVAVERHDLAGALTSYETLLQSRRFLRCRSLAETRRDAAVNSALLMTRLGRHRSASRRWLRAARMLGGLVARQARLRAAEETLRAGDARLAASRLDVWLRSGPATVAAQTLRARAAEALGDERRRTRALTAALRQFTAQPTAVDRAAAAHAALALARTFERVTPTRRIAPGRRATVAALLAETRRQLAQRRERTLAVVTHYDEVVASVSRVRA